MCILFRIIKFNRININISHSNIVEVNERCKEAFTKYAGAKCIVYDDFDCDDKDAGLGLSAGEEKSLDSDNDLYDNIESVSVAFGCYLEIWTGMLKKTFHCLNERYNIIQLKIKKPHLSYLNYFTFQTKSFQANLELLKTLLRTIYINEC